jgi:Mg-chelatase subunit ChlD
MKRNIAIALLNIALSTICFAQSGRITPTPTPDEEKSDVVVTEEIKLNLSAIDNNGNFVKSLETDDLVILENNVLHQAASVRKIPASVLIILDTGGEDRQAKDFATTRNTASNLVNLLVKDDSIAVIQYHDKIETLIEWTSDRVEISRALKSKMTFGKSSRFVDALDFASQYISKSPNDNRHLVLITDGLDSSKSNTERTNAIKRLLSTTINVHILSYSRMEQIVSAQRAKIAKKPPVTVSKLPPGAGNQDPSVPKNYPNIAIGLDREMAKAIKQRSDDLAKSQQVLTELSEDANGEIYLPETREEMIEKAEILAKNIDSQYVVTYVPKRSLSAVKADEMRIIEVFSRRSGVSVQAKRKLFVRKVN